MRLRLRASVEIDSEFLEENHAAFGDLAAIIGQRQVIVSDQCIGKTNAKLAGEVIVTGASDPHRVIELRRRAMPRWRISHHCHDTFQHLGNTVGGNTVVTVPALLDASNQPTLAELAEMTAGGLRRHAGGVGKFGRCERPASHQGRENIGTRWVTDQRRDFSDTNVGGHRSASVRNHRTKYNAPIA